MADEDIRVTLEQQSDFSFLVTFDRTGAADLLTDEMPPLGQGAGPNPSRLLLAAIANCLSASLLFALRKFHNQPGPIRATANARLQRNEVGRLRIPHVDVELHLAGAAADYREIERILDQFQNFCTVTESVRQGIDVAVTVRDASGAVLRERSDLALTA